MQSRWTDIDGSTVHANEWVSDPSKPEVVLVHGIIVSARYMSPLGEALKSDFNVHAPDLPGHGKSHKPQHPLSPTELAEWLLKWMDASGIGKAVVYGHSFGCQIAAEAATIAPDRVKALVIAGPTTDARARSPWQQAARWIQNLPHESVLKEAPDALRDAIDYGPTRAVAALRGQCRHRVEEPLVAAQCPILILRGEKDPVSPEGWCKRLATLAGAELKSVPGAGHNVHATRPAEVAKVISDMADA